MSNIVVVLHTSDGTVTVEPRKLPVIGPAGTPVTVTWVPGNEETRITSIAGFPSEVDVMGPDSENQWTASYQLPGNAAVWSYTVGSEHVSGSRATIKDPEIDNTPTG